MIGRLYNEAHGEHFVNTHPEGITKFLSTRLAKELKFETLKGQEMLVDLSRRGNADGTVVGKLARLDHAAEDANDADIHAPFRATTLSCVGWKSAACPYKIDETLLVVGEADFSWSASLSRRRREDGRSQSGGTRCSHRCFVGRLLATSYEDLRTLESKYAQVDASISELRDAGAIVAHGVDGTDLRSCEVVRDHAPFDVVLFNFPHVGSNQGLANSIAENKALLRGFLASASELLAPLGEVHVTLVYRYPYTAWLSQLRDETAGFKLLGLEYLGNSEFDFAAYPGYSHQATTHVEKGALNVATRCLTHAWRRVKEAPKTSLASSKAGANGASPCAKSSKRRKRVRSPAAMSAATAEGAAAAPTAAAFHVDAHADAKAGQNKSSLTSSPAPAARQVASTGVAQQQPALPRRQAQTEDQKLQERFVRQMQKSKSLREGDSGRDIGSHSQQSGEAGQAKRRKKATKMYAGAEGPRLVGQASAKSSSLPGSAKKAGAGRLAKPESGIDVTTQKAEADLASASAFKKVKKGVAEVKIAKAIVKEQLGMTASKKKLAKAVVENGSAKHVLKKKLAKAVSSMKPGSLSSI